MTAVDETVLDHPVWGALTGPHAGLAIRRSSAVRYDAAVSPFAAVDPDDPDGWSDLRDLVGDGTAAVVGTAPTSLPEGWELLRHLPVLQMVETSPVRSVGADEVVGLGAEDVDEMLALTARTAPGPFLRDTIRLGGYVGVRDGAGRLVAMGGRRLAVDGWREVSAVCTDERVRGRGLAGRVLSAVTAAIRAEGDRPFLHVTRGNPAVELYRRCGFTVRRSIDILVVRPRA